MQADKNHACGSEQANTDSTPTRATQTQQKACLTAHAMQAKHMPATTNRHAGHESHATAFTHHTKQQDCAHSTCTQGRHEHKKDANGGQHYMQSASTPGCARRWASKATMRAKAEHGTPWAQECRCAPRWGHAARKATRYPRCMRGLGGLGERMQCAPTAQAAAHAYTSQQYVACRTAPVSSPDWRIGAYVRRSSLSGRPDAHGRFPNSSRL
jgi:hypothetical protein